MTDGEANNINTRLPEGQTPSPETTPRTQDTDENILQNAEVVATNETQNTERRMINLGVGRGLSSAPPELPPQSTTPQETDRPSETISPPPRLGLSEINRDANILPRENNSQQNLGLDTDINTSWNNLSEELQIGLKEFAIEHIIAIISGEVPNGDDRAYLNSLTDMPQEVKDEIRAEVERRMSR